MTIKGSCHCGATTFSVEAAPESVTRCTCSICSKKGALWAYYTPAEVKFETPAVTATYRWQSNSVEHNFCPHCGCTTYTKSPSWEDFKPNFEKPRIALNARLFNDFDLDAVAVEVIDGKNLW
ncbi:MAG: GFA family protein [Asticcacaulis sp.]|nr:GFA family protein [Asticcacaulis sp.]